MLQGFLEMSHFLMSLSSCRIHFTGKNGLDEGQSSSDTMVLRLSKRTHIPSALTLLHEQSSRLSLQPSGPMNVNDLNDLLSDFCSQSATFSNASDWMDANEYHNAVADDAVQKWMCQ